MIKTIFDPGTNNNDSTMVPSLVNEYITEDTLVKFYSAKDYLTMFNNNSKEPFQENFVRNMKNHKFYDKQSLCGRDPIILV